MLLFVKINRLFACSVLVIIFTLTGAKAQPVYPYWDQYNMHFNVFDNGQIRNIEIQKPQSFKAGSNVCAYVSNVNDFKIYFNGKTTIVSRFVPKSYDCSNSMVSWNTGTGSFVFYNGNVKKLCDGCSGITMNDSMVQFIDRYGFFSVFYNNRIRSLEISPETGFTLGRNLIAFVDRNNYLKVWYHDTTVILENSHANLKYSCGLNTVGFIDVTNRLRVFYKNKIFTLDKLPPKNFVVGDDMVAWVDQNNNLRVFHKGNVFLLENYDPGNFNIIDGVMFYKSNINELKVFENGKGRAIETYFPTSFSAKNNLLVYSDFRNRLKAYVDGEVYNVSDDIVTSYAVYPGLVAFYSNAKSLTFWTKEDHIEVQLN